jgi:hypothetical protein
MSGVVMVLVMMAPVMAMMPMTRPAHALMIALACMNSRHIVLGRLGSRAALAEEQAESECRDAQALANKVHTYPFARVVVKLADQRVSPRRAAPTGRTPPRALNCTRFRLATRASPKNQGV